MTIEKKFIKNGNGWALTINKTILHLLDVNPQEDLVNYTVMNNKLIITKAIKNYSQDS